MPWPPPLAPFPTAKQLTRAPLLQAEDGPGQLKPEEIPVAMFQGWDSCALMPTALLFSFESYLLRVTHVESSSPLLLLKQIPGGRYVHGLNTKATPVASKLTSPSLQS